jgi:hypothetical protein
MASLTLVPSACTDDLLDQQPTTELGKQAFWQTEADATTALMGAYAAVRPLFDRDYYFDGQGEYVRARSGTSSTVSGDLRRGDAYRADYNPSGYGDNFDNMYRYLYGGVNRTNYVIENVTNMLATAKPTSIEGLETVIAEARLLRGMVYFRLISMWGDVPYFDAGRANLLVSGAAGAGKTTLLAALLAEAPAHERIVTIEDVAELRIAHPHHVRLEARQPNIEGFGGIGLARLVREALRMRPDRLVVGECRGDEVRELLSALNTGHDGGAGTVHANGLHDVPARLEALGAPAGLDDRALARQAASAIGLVVHVERSADGSRRIAGAGRPVVGGDGRLAIEEERWGSR